LRSLCILLPRMHMSAPIGFLIPRRHESRSTRMCCTHPPDDFIPYPAPSALSHPSASRRPEVGRVLVPPVLCLMDTRGSGSRRPSPQSPDQCSPHYCREWSGRSVSSRNSLHLLPLQPQVLVGVPALLHPVNLRLRVGYPQSLVEAVLFVLVPLVFVLIDRLNETRPPQSPSLY